MDIFLHERESRKLRETAAREDRRHRREFGDVSGPARRAQSTQFNVRGPIVDVVRGAIPVLIVAGVVAAAFSVLEIVANAVA